MDAGALARRDHVGGNVRRSAGHGIPRARWRRAALDAGRSAVPRARPQSGFAARPWPARPTRDRVDASRRTVWPMVRRNVAARPAKRVEGWHDRSRTARVFLLAYRRALADPSLTDGVIAARRAGVADVVALSPGDARSRGSIHLPRVVRARHGAAARRALAPRDLSAPGARRMIRPELARWFEILVARDDAALALEALATTNATELEARPSAVLPATLADLRPLVQRYAEYSLRYHAYWPPSKHPSAAFPEPPAATLARCLDRIGAWELDALPVIEQLQRCSGGAMRNSLVWQTRACRHGRRRDRSRARRPRPARSFTRDSSCSRPRASRRFRLDCSCVASRSMARSTRLPSVPKASCRPSRNRSPHSRAERIRCPLGCTPNLARTPRTSRRASAALENEAARAHDAA